MSNSTQARPTGTGSDTPTADDEAAPAAGLVTSPITRETDFAADLIRETFNFPSADMLDAAASMFPVARDAPIATAWHGLVGRGVATESKHAIAGYAEHRENREGPRPRIEIAPGLVRLAHRDEAKAERTRERIAEAERAATAYELEQLRRPMALASLTPLSKGRREQITSWSADSRARMIAAICELDLAPIVAGVTIPAMVTLTLPGDWLAVAPDAKTAARRFDNFMRAWADAWGPISCIWKREFQRRGAPHWHLWTVPPVPTHRMREFKAWLSSTWTRVLFGRRAVADALTHGPCSCSEVCRSLRAGTGLDFAEGLRARDPKRLAVYFLKESLGGEGKAYQNAAPAEWEGQSIGRFWGYRGIDKAVVTVDVDAGVDVQLARVLRRWQRSKGITRQVVVQRVDTRTGRVYTRKVRRPARVIGSAGWVAANSGASLAADLGRWACIVSAALWRDRDLFAADPDHESVSWPLWAAHGPLRHGAGFPVPAVR